MSTEKTCKIKCDINTSIFTAYTPIPEDNKNSTSWKNAFGFYKQWRMNAPKKWKMSLEKTKKSLACKLLHYFSRRCLPAIEWVTWNAIPNNADMDPLALANWHDKSYNWILSKCRRDNVVVVLQ